MTVLELTVGGRRPRERDREIDRLNVEIDKLVAERRVLVAAIVRTEVIDEVETAGLTPGGSTTG